MLRPLYTRRPFELTLIGEPFAGKRTLAKEFLKCRDVFFTINVSNSLPQKNIRRTDFILFFVDMTNRTCLDQLEDALERFQAKYSRLAVIITKVDLPKQWVLEKKEIETLLLHHVGFDVFYTNLSDPEDRKATAEQITQLFKTETLQYRNIDADYMKSQRFSLLSPQEELEDVDMD